MPCLRSGSWKSKLAAKDWRRTQKVNIAIRNHVELKTEAPWGWFCISLFAFMPPHLSVFQALRLCHLLFYKAWPKEHETSEWEGTSEKSCSTSSFLKERKWSSEKQSGCLKITSMLVKISPRAQREFIPQELWACPLCTPSPGLASLPCPSICA